MMQTIRARRIQLSADEKNFELESDGRTDQLEDKQIGCESFSLAQEWTGRRPQHGGFDGFFGLVRPLLSLLSQ